MPRTVITCRNLFGAKLARACAHRLIFLIATGQIGGHDLHAELRLITKKTVSAARYNFENAYR